MNFENIKNFTNKSSINFHTVLKGFPDTKWNEHINSPTTPPVFELIYRSDNRYDYRMRKNLGCI